MNYSKETLLVFNRGEIALRIIRSAKHLGLYAVAVYTPSDARAPHVLLANDSIALICSDSPTGPESLAYFSIDNVINCIQRYNSDKKDRPITLIHPGYGFLSENGEFASRIQKETSATWVGPKPEIISQMGLKHVAREVAIRAGIPIVPGTDSLLDYESDTELAEVAKKIGFPVILKATAGGGGMGMVVCYDEEQLLGEAQKAKERAQSLFNDPRIFLERYLACARHIEIQIFGNGLGDVVHMAERECSIQRKHQKIIEETPSPFLELRPGLREKMCSAAVSLGRSISYGSAGTVEFIVDDSTENFYLLEMNTRVQVEHPITEVVHPGLDIIKLMIQQAMLERTGRGFPSSAAEMQQSTYDKLRQQGEEKRQKHAIEVRLYAENPAENFVPAPGLLQYVEFDSGDNDWLRIENWVSTGTTITPFFDPLLCKLIVAGNTREEATERLSLVLGKSKVCGPPNNVEYLKAILHSEEFRNGRTTTAFVNNFKFIPRALSIISVGIDMTIQDFPGRTVGLGIPRSGPMDPLAFSIGNILVGNPETTEGIEMVLLPGMTVCSVRFFCKAVVAVTGKNVDVNIDDNPAKVWTKLIVPEGGTLTLEANADETAHYTGFRAYICVRGGFPDISKYLGSKSTSMGLGGYQGRALLAGDQLGLGDCSPSASEELERPFSIGLLPHLIPNYSTEWIVHVLSGPHDEEQYLTKKGIEKFYATKWIIGASSNRLGIRLESPEGSKLEWAREDGGEGGSHPSNILDTGYALGTINLNGDTPVILTNEGPDMGGYLCLCTVASAELWKLGQLNPGCSVQFRRITWDMALDLKNQLSSYYFSVKNFVSGRLTSSEIESVRHPGLVMLDETSNGPLLHVKAQEEGVMPVTYRQAGDGAILIDFAEMKLDLFARARIHAFQVALTEHMIHGILSLCPCIRSIMCHFNPMEMSQQDFLRILIRVEETLPSSVSEMKFPGRRLTFPIVLNDSWNRDALEKYMLTTRNKAVYLPSNVEYLAANNGLEGGIPEALDKLIKSDWLVLGIGFYLSCPFLVPIDPRCRLEGQKMNPSRTYTPRGAIGIAGPVTAIYPIESPGGYQLYGRTLPTWQTWGKGKDFTPETPWLLRPFDQIHFETIDESEYLMLEKDFDAGLYSFKIEDVTFSMAEYSDFIETIQEEVNIFRLKQSAAKKKVASRENELLREWEKEKRSQSKPANLNYQFSDQGSSSINSTLYASIWKIKCQPGDKVKTADDVLLILEAMKSEIPVKAGKKHVGKTVKGFGRGIEEQAVVRPGDVLVILI